MGTSARSGVLLGLREGSRAGRPSGRLGISRWFPLPPMSYALGSATAADGDRHPEPVNATGMTGA